MDKFFKKLSTWNYLDLFNLQKLNAEGHEHLNWRIPLKKKEIQ